MYVTRCAVICYSFYFDIILIMNFFRGGRFLRPYLIEADVLGQSEQRRTRPKLARTSDAERLWRRLEGRLPPQSGLNKLQRSERQPREPTVLSVSQKPGSRVTKSGAQNADGRGGMATLDFEMKWMLWFDG